MIVSLLTGVGGSAAFGFPCIEHLCLYRSGYFRALLPSRWQKVSFCLVFTVFSFVTVPHTNYGVCSKGTKTAGVLPTPSPTPTQYVVNTLYWPHTALSVYLVCYFLVPHTYHVLCMGSGSATGKKKFRWDWCILYWNIFFKFQLWYWIQNLHYQIFKFVIDNSDISLNCLLAHTEKEKFWLQKWHVTSQFVYCYMPY